jgi:toxin HigB-1
MPRGFPSDLAKVSRRKLRTLAAATRLEELRQPPANHLEALAGDRAGQHSIRVNDQWRLCAMAMRTTLQSSITMEGDDGHPY